MENFISDVSGIQNIQLAALDADPRNNMQRYSHFASDELPGKEAEAGLALQTNCDTGSSERTLELIHENKQLHSELVLCRRQEHELREALAAAVAANKTRTLFLANMSHELRTPLNAIIGFSDVIHTELFGPSGYAKYIDYAKDINSAGMYMLRLINDLLDVSRVEAGELSLNEDIVDFTDCIVNCLHLLGKHAHSKRIFLSRGIAGDLPCMRGDETRIMQVLINLIGNAIKFTPGGGDVRVGAAKLAGGEIQIVISDTGIGIAPGDLSKVCEPFAQVANVLTRAHHGAGLGLPLAKLLTERHDGTFEIHSVPERGTTVTLTFPASRTVLEKSAC